MWNQKPPILIAEDDPNDAFILQRNLKKVGINNPVQLVENGLQALAYLRGEGKYQDRLAYPFPGVIITDLKMPGLDGFEILKWLRNHPECGVIPVVILSASALEADIIKGYQLGANCYLQKPSSPDEFIRLIQLLFDFWNVCQIPKLTASVCAQENPPDKK